MGLRGCSVHFPDRVPSYEALKARAEGLGGLPLVFDAGTTELAFAHLPQRVIALDRRQDNLSLHIVDEQQSSPVLFELLVRTAEDLGGQRAHPDAWQPKPMPVPLTFEYIEREYRSYQRAGCGVALIILGALLVVLLLLAGFAWAAWHAIGSLFGGQ